MNTLHFYAAKSKALRAAKSKLGESIVEGVDFEYVAGPVKGTWAFQPIVKAAPKPKLPHVFNVTRVISGKKVTSETAKKPAAEKLEKVAKRPSAKSFLRSFFSNAKTKMTMLDLTKEGYTEINLKTAISDLKNPAYCGPEGQLFIVSVVIDGVRYYRRENRTA